MSYTFKQKLKGYANILDDKNTWRRRDWRSKVPFKKYIVNHLQSRSSHRNWNRWIQKWLFKNGSCQTLKIRHVHDTGCIGQMGIMIILSLVHCLGSYSQLYYQTTDTLSWSLQTGVWSHFLSITSVWACSLMSSSEIVVLQR